MAFSIQKDRTRGREGHRGLTQNQDVLPMWHWHTRCQNSVVSMCPFSEQRASTHVHFLCITTTSRQSANPASGMCSNSTPEVFSEGKKQATDKRKTLKTFPVKGCHTRTVQLEAKSGTKNRCFPAEDKMLCTQPWRWIDLISFIFFNRMISPECITLSHGQSQRACLHQSVQAGKKGLLWRVHNLLQSLPKWKTCVCGQVNDCKANQPVDSGLEGDGSQVKCPKRPKYADQQSQNSFMWSQEFSLSKRGHINFKHVSKS